MTLDNINGDYELFFHHEFIDDENFQDAKKSLLEKDGATYFIKDDFTIYQTKAHPKSSINKADFINNRATFARILFHLSPHKVEPYIKYHFDKYTGNKKSFIDFVKYEFIGSKLTQGDKELPDPQQKVIMLEWLERKRNRSVRNWLLKSENLKWIIGFIVATVLAIVGLWLKSRV